MICEFCDHWQYRQQQTLLDEIATTLGVVCFRPTYHAKTRDKNTVLLYTKADDRLCRELDRKGTPCDDPSYPRHFWSFANTDRNGCFSFDFANFGNLYLGGPRWREVLEGDIRIALIKKAERDYIGGTGVFDLKESDEYHNGLNRDLIQAMKMRYGKCFLGKVNFYDDEQKAIAAGEKSPFVEYTGQKVYNFGCSFCIPDRNDELEALIRKWNQEAKIETVSAITELVEKLGGSNFIWT